MVNHVHHKNGKFRIWSTYVDDFITEWVDKETIIKHYIETSKAAATLNADINIQRAIEFGCSAGKPARCDEL